MVDASPYCDPSSWYHTQSSGSLLPALNLTTGRPRASKSRCCQQWFGRCMKVICLPIFKSLQKLLANAPIVSGDTPQASSENPPPGDFIPLGIRPLPWQMVNRSQLSCKGAQAGPHPGLETPKRAMTEQGLNLSKQRGFGGDMPCVYTKFPFNHYP